MPTVAATVLLLIFVASPTVVELGDGRYRTTIIHRSGDMHAAAQAQLQLHAVAQRICRGRGDVLSEGLEVNRGPRRNQLAVSETFTCRQR